jgi:hypothetical protein
MFGLAFPSPWKLATGGAAIIALLLTVLLFSSYKVNQDLTQQRAVLQKSINDPETGFIVQLAQARTNVETLKVEVERQSQAYDKLSKDSEIALAAARAKLAVAQQETKAIERKVAGFLATKPQGATLEDRIRDIDDRAMKEFLP